MKVQQILRSKANDAIHSIGPGETLSDAIAALSGKRIGALVVCSEKGDVEGILSERDIVGRLGASGAGALQLQVREVMTSEVESCHPDESANSVLERMTNGRFRHMPVMEDDRIVGVLSIGDVVKARLDDIERENRAMAEMLSG